MSKATMATVKSFIKKNLHILVVEGHSRWSGQTDGLEYNNVTRRVIPKMYDPENKNTFGLPIAWFVGGGRDYITPVKGGYEITNSCGNFTIRVQEFL